MYIEKQPVPWGKPEPVFKLIKMREEVVIENLLIARCQTRSYGNVGIE